jgi:uncharacterized linocin/CFP29 family protein
MTTQAAYPHMNGRDKVPWSEEVWKRLDAAVHEEMTRARIAAKFMPTVYVPAKTLTAPSDTVLLPGSVSPAVAGALSVDEGTTTRINEYWVEFVMTPAQVEHEAAAEVAMAHGHSASTGVTLATRAANILAQGEDTVIFQGLNAFSTPLFTGSPPLVSSRGVPTDLGLMNIVLTGTPQSPPNLPNALQVIAVPPASPPPWTGFPYQDRTVAAVAQAYSVLQSFGQYGPYALVLETAPFADAHSPLPNTLILPADPIKELVTAGFYGTGTVPPWTLQLSPPGPITGPLNGLPPYGSSSGSSMTYGGSSSSSSSAIEVLFTGVVVSIGGNTMDLLRGSLHPEHDVVVTFEQKDVNGDYRFRVVERFALRLKDPTAVALLEFLSAIPPGS